MKRSYLLTLIAWALLLCAAKTGSGATPSNPSHATQIEQTASAQNATTTPTATLRNQVRTIPTSSQTTAYTDKDHYPAQQTWLTFFGQIAAIANAVLLTLFTGGLWWTSCRQWQVANKTLVSVARPKLVVRWLRILRFEPEELFKLEYTVVNIGASTARIVESNVAVIRSILGPIPLTRPPYASANIIGQVSIESGTWLSRTYESKEIVTKDMYSMAYEGDFIYFFVGYVLCADQIGNKRLTAFCRRFDPINRTFAYVDSEEHESAD